MTALIAFPIFFARLFLSMLRFLLTFAKIVFSVWVFGWLIWWCLSGIYHGRIGSLDNIGNVMAITVFVWTLKYAISDIGDDIALHIRRNTAEEQGESDNGWHSKARQQT